MSCRWRLSDFESPADVDAPQYFHCLDLLLSIVPTSCADIGRQDNKNGGSIPFATGTYLENLVRICCTIRASAAEGEIAIKVILVPRAGFLCRSDILKLRMRHSEFIDSVIPFSNPGERFAPVTAYGGGTLLDLLPSSPGALLVKQSSLSHHEILDLLGKDLRVRLSFDWVLPTKPATRRAAVVGGRPVFDMKRGSYGAAGPFEAAQALGLSVIVLDQRGHWLEGEPYSYLRDGFIAIDVANDAELPLIIAEAVKGRDIDCVVTFSDEFVIASAKAAEILNLPTEPVQAILHAHYKDETRKLVENPNIQVLRLDSAEQLNDPSLTERLKALHYPLIVKPCRGAGSRGVMRVNNYSSMRQAVQKMKEDGFSKHGILLETYVDGPEVDANLIIWDGELLFFEISDDFPCLADGTDATIADNFTETLMFLPSRLDADEIEMLRSSLHRSLLQLGFRSGVYHMEARVQNSSMSYKETDGILDLADANTTAKGRPDIFLIEVNARPPGLDCAFSTLHTYGVDLCALHFLRALGDRDCFAALSKPFSCFAQYWCGNCQVPMHRESILVPDDFFERVYQQLPEIVPHVSRAELFVQPETLVSPRGGCGFIAYFLLYSRTSRRHVLEMSDRVQKVSKKILDSI